MEEKGCQKPTFLCAIKKKGAGNNCSPGQWGEEMVDGEGGVKKVVFPLLLKVGKGGGKTMELWMGARGKLYALQLCLAMH